MVTGPTYNYSLMKDGTDASAFKPSTADHCAANCQLPAAGNLLSMSADLHAYYHPPNANYLCRLLFVDQKSKVMNSHCCCDLAWQERHVRTCCEERGLAWVEACCCQRVSQLYLGQVSSNKLGARVLQGGGGGAQHMMSPFDR
jgi:hypothetical protein